MQIYVDGIGVRGPGLYGWSEAKQILTGVSSHDALQTTRYEEKYLPANERRRASPIVRLAIDVGFEALSRSNTSAAEVATVFGTSGGDGSAVHDICVALATPEREVSPTRFHNSVHNAPAGYWNIAAGSQQASTTISGYDVSFAIGLLEAATLVLSRKKDVLLVVCDMPYPFPLANARPMRDSFATALLLRPHRTDHNMATLMISVDAGTTAATRIENSAQLEALRETVPSARALPLLQAIAKRSDYPLCFELYASTQLVVNIGYA